MSAKRKTKLDAPVDWLGRPKPKVKPHQFYCVICQKVYKKGWSDEEAMEEKNELYPGIPTTECDYLCDDCFQIMQSIDGDKE
jgi:hypothetical protein